MKQNKLVNLKLQLLTETSEYMCYKYDKENKLLYLDFCFSGDLEDVDFSPFAFVKEIEEEEIPEAAEICIGMYGRYGTIMATYAQLLEFSIDDDCTC